jgi:chromosome segregation ATPase
MIPAYLDDRDRLRARIETVEEDNTRLRAELADARREIAQLCGEIDFHRGERSRVAENFRGIMEHLTALQGPVNDIASRLDAQPTGAEIRM